MWRTFACATTTVGQNNSTGQGHTQTLQGTRADDPTRLSTLLYTDSAQVSRRVRDLYRTGYPITCHITSPEGVLETQFTGNQCPALHFAIPETMRPFSLCYFLDNCSDIFIAAARSLRVRITTVLPTARVLDLGSLCRPLRGCELPRLWHGVTSSPPLQIP